MRRNRARAFMGASGHRVALVTLTVDPEDPRFQGAVGYYRDAGAGGPDGIMPVASIDYVRSLAWPNFRKQLSREYGRVGWLRGLELTRAGIAHVHVLIRVRDVAEYLALRSLIRGVEADRADRRGLPRSAGAGLAERAGFGIVSDVQLARAAGDVARYVTKLTSSSSLTPAAYATKGIADGRMPKYTRRASWSGGRAPWAPDWRRAVPLAGFTWRVAAAAPDRVLQGLRASGYVIEDPHMLRAMAGGEPPGREH